MTRPVAISCVITVGLFASILFAAALAISPSLRLLDGAQYLLVKQAQIRILQVSMTIISSIYSALAVWLLVLERKQKSRPLFRLTAASLVLITVALLYSIPTDIAYNQQILAWLTPPADWASVRDDWDFANRVRAVPSLMAFVLQTVALLYLNPKSA